MAPVADINELFESGRYFDGSTVIKYPTGESLVERYLRPLVIDLEKDVWLTNVVKCYLVDESDIAAYRHGFGWIDAGGAWVDETGETHTVENTEEVDYNQVAGLCVQRYLRRELALCQPKLIIALGLEVYDLIHSDEKWRPVVKDDNRWKKIMGIPLLADRQSHPTLDKRNPLFAKYNVVHLTHPSRFVRETSPQALRELEKMQLDHLEAVKPLLA